MTVFDKELADGEPGLGLRLAIYGGLLSSLGVTLGWLFWVALQALKRPHGLVEVALAVFVGAAVGALVEWLREYRAEARRERSGAAEPEERAAEDAPDEARQARRYGPALRIFGVTLGFLSLVCEHLVADLIKEVLLPFLTSVATLFPVGAFFALALERKPAENPGCNFFGWFLRVLIGALLGLGAAAIAIAIHWAMGQSHGLWAEVGWWVLAGVGFSLVGSAASRPLSPVPGILLAFVLMISVCKWPPTLQFHQAASWPSALLMLTDAVLVEAANGALSDPDLPEQSWKDAEASIQKEADRREAPAASGWERGACRWLDCDGLSEPNDPSVPPPQTFTNPLSRMEADPLARDEAQAREFGLTPKRRLCEKLQTAQGAGFVRSWLVLLLFSVGLGLTRTVESRLRPDDYGESRTRHNDQVLLGIVIAVVLTAIVLAHVLAP